MPLVAGRNEQQLVGLILRVGRGQLPVEQLQYPFAVHQQVLLDQPPLGLLQDFRQGLPIGRAEHPRAGVVIGIHKAQGHQPVEPGVGDFLHEGGFPFFLQPPLQLVDLLLAFALFEAIGTQHLLQAVADLLDQLAAGVLCEGFEGGGLHGWLGFD